MLEQEVVESVAQLCPGVCLIHSRKVLFLGELRELDFLALELLEKAGELRDEFV